MFTIYSADVKGNPGNCSYPHKHIIINGDTLRNAVSHDYVCAEYKNSYRNGDNFIGSDCLPVDCDNDHSENPDDWISPEDVRNAFPDVRFAVHYSRSNNKVKNGRAARPKFHILFPIDYVTDAKVYADMKKIVNSIFPYFDTQALDAARFFFGTSPADVVLYPGSMNLTEYLNDDKFDADMSGGTYGSVTIPQGSRNATMSNYAGRILIRYGNTEKAHELYLEYAQNCDPPLDSHELDTIWRSAINFYKKVSSQDSYIPPEKYNQEFVLQPTDYSDVGQAALLSREYIGQIRYTPSTDYLVYNGSYWEESKPKSQAVAQELTTRQLEEAETEIQKLIKEMTNNGAWELMVSMGVKKAVAAMNPIQKRSFEKYDTATTYRNYAIKRRDSKYITSALKEARPMLEIDQHDLDADEFLLNTPSATYDLSKGLTAFYAHKPEDFITKQTSVDPDNKNEDVWLSALNTFFINDAELIDYVQEIVGLAAIGKVCLEALIIAYGEGRNGKSTFWNVVARVMGSYSGNMSADTLTVGCKRNVKPELAEAKGKRLLIAAELEEGMRLSTSNVKQLCSTDEIYAEKKYKDPFSYVPTHTLVLYTNHLPRVGALDAGTWRRLIVIPFNAVIDGTSDIKNYADYLYKKCGGAILSWIIEGAKRVIANDYRIVKPQVVENAIRQYKENNDWLSQFLDECCEVDKSYQVKSGEFYNAYRNYCTQMGEYTRGTTDFYTAIEQAGFEKRKTKKGAFILGLRLKSEFLS